MGGKENKCREYQLATLVRTRGTPKTSTSSKANLCKAYLLENQGSLLNKAIAMLAIAEQCGGFYPNAPNPH